MADVVFGTSCLLLRPVSKKIHSFLTWDLVSKIIVFHYQVVSVAHRIWSGKHQWVTLRHQGLQLGYFCLLQNSTRTPPLHDEVIRGSSWGGVSACTALNRAAFQWAYSTSLKHWALILCSKQRCPGKQCPFDSANVIFRRSVLNSHSVQPSIWLLARFH